MRVRSPTTPRLPQNRHRMANDEPNGIGGRGGQESRIFGENAIQSGQRRSILSGSGSESHEFECEADQKRPRRSAEAEQQWIGMCLQSSETAEFGNLRCRYRLYRMLRAFGLFGVCHGRIGPPLPSCDLALPLPGCWPRLFAQVLSRTGRRGRGRDHHPEEPLPGLVGEELARLPRSARASPIPSTRIAHPTRPTTTRHECYHRTHSTHTRKRAWGGSTARAICIYSNSGTSRTAPASARSAARALHAASSGCPRDIPQAGAGRDNRPSGRDHITFAGGDVFTGGGPAGVREAALHAALD